MLLPLVLSACTDPPPPNATQFWGPPDLDGGFTYGLGGGGGSTSGGGGYTTSSGCTAPSPNGFCWVGRDGEIVSGGKDVSLGPDDMTMSRYWSSYSPNTISFTVTPTVSATRYFFDFEPSSGDALTTKRYDGATMFNTHAPSVPGLYVVSELGSGCVSVTGYVVVRAITRAADQSVTRFVADFVQYCNGSSVPLRGQIRYQK